MHSTRSDIGSLDPDLVPLLVSKTDTTMYGQVAILTFLVYDTIITMDKEHIYLCGTKSSPCKFVSLIYFANRYVGILGAVSGIIVVALPANEPLCLGFSWIIGLSYILLMRVLALYHQGKALLISPKHQ
ncbi:hypothetical protein DFH11DRAFT_1548153 [Phellopilus nigrolimitatus]|nr:hypothetical protein DFH11DRAFT_1548153 [Phellopilus nigrolimitatus]